MIEKTLDTIPKSSVYKMDNVLYEIHDNSGISVKNDYDPWKQDALTNLISAHFVYETEGNYVLTEEGYKAIKCDSIISYRKRKYEEWSEKTPEEKSFFIKLFLGFGAYLSW